MEQPKIIMRDIMEIKPYIRNPRKNSKTIDMLVEIIPQVGFNVPIIIDKDGIIVKGHSRFAAALRLGMTEIPCIVSQNSDELNKLDRIADNRIAEFSKWDSSMLEFELDALTLPFDMLEFDFSHADETEVNFLDESDDVTEAQIQKAVDKLDDMKATYQYARITCEKCGHEQYVREKDLRYEIDV